MNELKRDVDINLFLEIKEAQKDGVISYDVCKQHNLSLVSVNEIFKSDNWNSYSGDETEESKLEKVSPARAGYFRSLVAKKAEENNSLKEQRGWLLEQVYFLRKAVAFLEGRKTELETGIKLLEKNMNTGITIMEQLEDNDEFQKLSLLTEKRNK